MAKSELTIKERYKIDIFPENILGKGSYGIVYKAVDVRDKTDLAAKSINGEKHPKLFKDNRQQLFELDHQNLTKIMDLYQTEKTFWIIMELCNHGDLNDFFRKKNPNMHQKVEIMTGIAQGITYLHSKDVIHRDIKPDNILMASEFPLIPKLTDFDLIKSLNYSNETMNSNVGTLAFKAPEFFTRTGGKLKYHKNVDIFAAGLTFLAMIQVKDHHKKLIPHIETPLDDSEIHTPIGQLIAERLKYNVPELNIVTINSSANTQEELTENSLRQLISRMTCHNPEERLLTGGVLNLLGQVRVIQIVIILNEFSRIIISLNKQCNICHFHFSTSLCKYL